MPVEMLWQAALLQAIKDACSVACSPGSGYPSGSEQDQARAWLLSNNGDFVRVCVMADMEPSRVHSWAVRKEAAGWPAVVYARNRSREAPLRAA